MVDKSNEYGYIPSSPTQAIGANTGIFEVNDVTDLLLANQWSKDLGQLELILTQTATADTELIFSSIQESSYDTHFLTYNITDLSTSAFMGIQFYESGVLESASVYHDNGYTNGTEVNSASRDRIIITQSNYTNTSTNGYIWLFNLGDNSKYSYCNFHGIGRSFPSSTTNYYWGGGALPQASTVNGIKFLPQAGNFTGKFSIYGLRNS